MTVIRGITCTFALSFSMSRTRLNIMIRTVDKIKRRCLVAEGNTDDTKVTESRAEHGEDGSCGALG